MLLQNLQELLVGKLIAATKVVFLLVSTLKTYYFEQFGSISILQKILILKNDISKIFTITRPRDLVHSFLY